MKLLPLSYDKFTMIDDEDFEYFNQFRWYYDIGNYAYRRIKTKKIWLHRALMKSSKDFVIDHIDGNGLNNQKSNLRICTHQQNIMNRNKNIGNNKYRGIYTYPYNPNRWCVSLKRRINNKIIRYRGSTTSEESAILLYNQKAKEFYGEFAKLNIIKED